MLGAAWTASAATAVGLGFLAVSLVGASASPQSPPVVGATVSAGAAPTSGAVSPSGEMATVGGTVYGSCTGGTPYLASAPAPGWWVDDSSTADHVEFKNGTEKVEIRTACVDGGPQFAVEGPRADDSGSSGPTSPAAPSSTEDSSGGHGAGNTPGDDSSGRRGGGHGSDG
jgi:hypothetical protein